jgi:hypothetical protein
VAVGSTSHETFAALAIEYCGLIETYEVLSPEQILHEGHRLIPQLYVAALGLPDVATDTGGYGTEEDEPEDGDDDLQTPPAYTEDPNTISTEAWMALWRAIGAKLGDRKFYREMFAPYDLAEEEPVVGDLADDFADIYRDLLRGLSKWRANDPDGAAWEWQFHFAVHWGDHATSAMRALHALAFDYALGPPPLRSDV